MARIALLAPLAWAVPERHWPKVARAVANLHLLLQAQNREKYRQRLSLLQGHVDPVALDNMPAANMAAGYLARMQGFREYRPGGWHPDIRIEGTDHIEAALARGHGAVLWVAPFVFSDLVTKKGLFDAGYRVSHLSRPSHNISDTRFGMAVLNPVWTRIERRYLAERVVIRRDNPSSALATLRDRLRENRLVSITVGDQARRTEAADLLNGRLQIATGPLHLAATMDASLLPVFTVERERGDFVVRVGRPLIPGREYGDAGYDRIVESYARRLEPYLLRYPDQWIAAESMTPAHDSAPEQLVAAV